ncbi:hypothetical protein ACFS3C_07655 [Azotobacter vinelandii]
MKKYLYLLAILCCGVIYVSQCWSPSSYGLVLRQIGVEDTGIVFLVSRGPFALMSGGVVTPFTQATVNNDFERYNKTSFLWRGFANKLWAADLRLGVVVQA